MHARFLVASRLFVLELQMFENDPNIAQQIVVSTVGGVRAHDSSHQTNHYCLLRVFYVIPHSMR